jgi:hypothetical protein
MKNKGSEPNVNVTLPPGPNGGLLGRRFPCPTCGVALSIRMSQSSKPYCVCFDCGNQVFFRGKLGIHRLTELVESGKLITEVEAREHSPAVMFNRLVHLRSQKAELLAKRGLIATDPDLENAIRAVDNEIASAQGELSRLANDGRKAK